MEGRDRMRLCVTVGIQYTGERMRERFSKAKKTPKIYLYLYRYIYNTYIYNISIYIFYKIHKIHRVVIRNKAFLNTDPF